MVKLIPPGILLATVGILLPFIPNITPETLQKALETINNPNATSDKDARPKKPLTRREAAKELGISVQSVDRYLAAGRLTRVQYSPRAIRISAESVYNLMKGGEL